MAADQIFTLIRRLGGTAQDVSDAALSISRITRSSQQTLAVHPWESSILADSSFGSNVSDFTLPSQAHTQNDIEDPLQPPHSTAPFKQRYQDIGLLGIGGMGEVRLVQDRQLGRAIAMKIIKRELSSSATTQARFIAEAQATAQLQHPGIVPVHELGTLPDGRHYFTMTRVRGRTLAEVISGVQAVSTEGSWEITPAGWTFRRLIDVFHRVCESVAYAHDCGVIHRDLKPENIMLGSHGEVLVLDWGLAKVRGQRDIAAEQGDFDLDDSNASTPQRVVTQRSSDDSQATRMGVVTGTPAYMAPEQASGEIDLIDERSDVYALGAMLYRHADHAIVADDGM